MKKRFAALLGSLTLPLVSCGGGGGGGTPGDGSGVAPAPTPTPAPAPTPPPPPPSGMSLVPFPVNANISQLSSQLQYEVRSGIVTNFRVGDPSASTLDIQQGSLVFVFAGRPIPPFNTDRVVFLGPQDRVAGRSDASFTAYQETREGFLWDLRLLNPGASNPQLALNYVGIGIVQASINQSGALFVDVRPFAYGYFAEQSAVPTTGTGRYSGIVIGRAGAGGQAGLYDVTGSIVMDLAYGERTFAGTVTLQGRHEQTGETVSFGSFQIAMDRPAIPLQNIVGVVGPNGDRFRAQLGGVSAEELGGTFVLSIPHPRAPGTTLTIAAAVGAKR